MIDITLSITALLALGFVLGLHVAVVLGLTAMIVGAVFIGPVWGFFGHVPWTAHSGITIVMVPLYIMMGELLLRSGMSDDLYGAFAKLLGNLPGGLLHTNIMASGVFAAVSGSSVATTSTIGSVALPAMRKHGYAERVSLGSIAAGGTLGILIPPSIIMIVYGLVAEVSIGKLYIAAIIPGLLMLTGFIAVIVMHSLRHRSGRPDAAVTLAEKLRSLANIVPVMVLIGLVLGTIYLGVATSVEAAAYGVTGAFLIALCKGRVNHRMLAEVFVSTASTSAMVILIIMSAFLLQFVLSFAGVPMALSSWMADLGLSQIELILLLCLVYILLGTVMDGLAIIVATLPIFLPVLIAADVDLIWFGVIVVILVELALITPPIGMNLFVMQGVRRKVAGADGSGSVTDVIRGVLPFTLAMLFVLALVIAFPQLSLLLVSDTIQ